MRALCTTFGLALALAAAPATAADPATSNRIADAALNHGQVVETLSLIHI